MGCSFSAARQAKKEADREEKTLKSRPEEQSGEENVLFEKPVSPEDAGIVPISGDVGIQVKGKEKTDLESKMPVVFNLGDNLLQDDKAGFIAEQEKKAESEMLDLANQLESQASETGNVAGDVWNEGVGGISGGVADLKSGAEGTVAEGKERFTDSVGAVKAAGKSAVTSGTEFVSVELEAAGDKAEAFATEGKENLSTGVAGMETKAEGLVDQAKEGLSTGAESAKVAAISVVSDGKDKLSSQTAAAKDEIESTAQSIVSESTKFALSKVKAAQEQAGNLVQEGQDKISTEVSGLEGKAGNLFSGGEDLVSKSQDHVSSEVTAARSAAADVVGDAQDQMSTKVTAVKETTEASMSQGAECVATEVDSVRSVGKSTFEQGQQGFDKEVQSADQTFESLMTEGGQSMSGGFGKLTSGAESMVNQGQDEFTAKASVAEDSATAAVSQTGEEFGNVEDFVSSVISQSVEKVSAETKDTAQEAGDESTGALEGAKSTAGNLLSQGQEFVSAQTGEIREKVEELVSQGKEYISQGLGQAGQAVSSKVSEGAGNIFNFGNVAQDDAKTDDAEASATTEEFSKQIVDSVMAGAMATFKGSPPPDEGTSVDGEMAAASPPSGLVSPGSSVDAPHTSDTDLIGQGREFVENQRDKVLSEISDQDSVSASLVSFGMSDDKTAEGPSTDSFDSSYSSELSRELGLGSARACSTTPSDARTFTPDAVDLSSPETLEGSIIPSALPSAVKDEIQKQAEPIVQALPSDVSSLTDVSPIMPDSPDFDAESSEPSLMAGSLESSLVSSIPTTDDEWRREAARKMAEIGNIGAEQTSELVDSLQALGDNTQVGQDLKQLNLPLGEKHSPNESSGDTTPTGPCGTALGCPGDPGHVDFPPETGHDPAIHGAKLEDRFYNNDSFKNSSIDPSDPHQQDAALSIQTQYRQHAAKEEVAKMQAEKTAPTTDKKAEEEEVDIDLNDPEVADAATKIQAGFRGYKARKEVHDIKEDEPVGESSPSKAEEEEVDIDLEDPETEKAALKIQAGFRGYKTRKDLKQGDSDESPEEESAEKPAGETEEIDIDLNDPEVEKAATKIQASFKGYKTRKDMKAEGSGAVEGEDKEASPPAEEAKTGDEEIDIDLEDPEVAAAATKIQASFRGHKTRQDLKESKADSSEEKTEEAGDGDTKEEEKTDEDGDQS